MLATKRRCRNRNHVAALVASNPTMIEIREAKRHLSGVTLAKSIGCLDPLLIMAASPCEEAVPISLQMAMTANEMVYLHM